MKVCFRRGGECTEPSMGDSDQVPALEQVHPGRIYGPRWPASHISWTSTSKEPQPGGCGVNTSGCRPCEHGGVLDSTPSWDSAHGIRTGPDVRTDTDVAAATSDAARVSGGALHVQFAHDSSNITQSSPSVAAATLGTDVRSLAPAGIESRLNTG